MYIKAKSNNVKSNNVKNKIANWTIIGCDDIEKGYREYTTCWIDFSIAETGGVNEVVRTFESMFDNLKENVKMVTELAIVLNWKMWDTAKHGNKNLCMCYYNLCEYVTGWCMTNLKGNDLDYFIQTTN